MTAVAAFRSHQAPGQSDTGSVSIADGFEAIYDAYHGRIFGLACRMMGNADDALDATQEAFVSAYLNLHKLRPCQGMRSDSDVHLSAWLHRVAANKCIDLLRKRKRAKIVLDDDILRKVPADTVSTSHPESYVLDNERLEKVQHVLNQMSPNYRLVLLLQAHQGLTIKEIAEIVDRSESAVKSMLFRAREQFRTTYELEGALSRAA